MNQEFVEKLTSPKVEKRYIYGGAKDLVVGKTYTEDLLDYCFKCFFESYNAYQDDFDSSKYKFKITLADKRYLICFDLENIYHLLGISKPALKKVVIINELLKKQFGTCPSEKGAFKYDYAGIKLFQKLCLLFLIHDIRIKKHDCNPINKNIEKLNWDKIAYKLYCFLNIGELSNGDTIFYSYKDSLLFERKMISSSEDKEHVLLIEFVPETKGSSIYNPKSIRIEERTSTRQYKIGYGAESKSYSRVKGLKKGFATIEKGDVN